MGSIIICLFILFVRFNTLVCSEKSCGRLPGLDCETIEASFGISACHSVMMKAKIGLFHMTGDEWTAPELGEYFRTGIFQHYAYLISGFNREYNYEKASPLNISSLLKKVLTIESEDKCLGKTVADLLNKALSSLEEEPIFMGLGICFHRNKVKLEKMNEALRYIPETEKCMPVRQRKFDEMMAIDRLAIDQQTAFYHWMKESLEESMAYVKNIYESAGALPGTDDESFLAIGRKRPGFLKLPVYENLVPLALAEMAK